MIYEYCQIMLSVLTKNKILQSSAINVLFSAMSNVLNYAFVLICINYLTPKEYADLALTISFYSIIGIFATTLSTTSLSLLSHHNNRSEKENIMSLAKVLILVLTIVSILVLTPFIKHFFDVGSYLNITIILLAGVVSIITSLLTVHFQVMGQYTRNGLAQVLSTILKFSFSFLALYLSFGLTGISVALLLSTIFTFILFYPRSEYGLLVERRAVNIFTTSLQFIKDNKSLIQKSLLSSLIAILCITADTILAKRLLDTDIASQFIGMSVVAKLFIYGTLAITTVIFPYILSVRDINVKKLYIKYLNLFILVTGTTWITLAYFFGEFFLQLILGDKYTSLADYFYLVCIISVTATLAYVNSHLASLLNVAKLNLTYTLSFIFSILLFIILMPADFTALSIYISSVFAFISILLYYVNIKSHLKLDKQMYEADKYNSPLL
jgi:O-antigen/teichoic acid export membrane protein